MFENIFNVSFSLSPAAQVFRFSVQHIHKMKNKPACQILRILNMNDLVLSSKTKMMSLNVSEMYSFDS